MRFFKHFTDAHRGKSIGRIRKNLGMAGVGMYWTLVELCSEKLEKSAAEEYTEEHCVFDFLASRLSNDLGTKSVRLPNVLGTFQDAELIAWESSGDIIRIEMPKLLECLDRDTKRARTERAPAAPKRKRKREEVDVNVRAQDAPEKSTPTPEKKLVNHGIGDLHPAERMELRLSPERERYKQALESLGVNGALEPYLDSIMRRWPRYDDFKTTANDLYVVQSKSGKKDSDLRRYITSAILYEIGARTQPATSPINSDNGGPK